MEKNAGGAQVVLLPYLAKGHFNRFLAFQEILARRYPHITVTLASTPRNVDLIRSSLPPASALRLHSLPFNPADHGLPAGAECTSDVPEHLLLNLMRACRSLEAPFEELISSISREAPLCIVSDGFHGWTVDTARKFGAFHALMAPGAYGSSVFLSMWTRLPHAATPADEFPLPDHPEIMIRRSELPPKLLEARPGNPTSEFFRQLKLQTDKTDFFLVNTAEELEGAIGLRMLRRIFAGPVLAIGPLLRVPSSPSSSSSGAGPEVMRWLETQSPASVLYVSFGSENSIEVKEMMELAVGLERARWPFIWTIRPPLGVADAKGGFSDEWFPSGFVERMATTMQGMLVRGWAPQVRILAHRSTGAFMSHCGWNSVMESLSHGVPIIAWPVGAEQPFNAKFLVEDVGVAVEVAPEDGEAKSVAVEKAVGVVLEETAKGRDIRRKAAEIKAMLAAAWEDGAGSSSRALEEFVKAAGLLRR